MGHTHEVEIDDIPPRREYGCCKDGISTRLPPSEAYPNGAVVYIPKGAKKPAMILEKCPLDNPNPRLAEYVEAGIFHATDYRTLDIEHSSETAVRMVLIVSAMHQKTPGGLGGFA